MSLNEAARGPASFPDFKVDDETSRRSRRWTASRSRSGSACRQRAWRWETFRHLGNDDSGNPIGLIDRIAALRETKAARRPRSRRPKQ